MSSIKMGAIDGLQVTPSMKVCSIDWQTHDKGLGEDPLWSWPHRKHKGHQTINHIHAQPSSKGGLCIPLFEGQHFVFNIPGSPGVYLWAWGPLCLTESGIQVFGCFSLISRFLPPCVIPTLSFDTFFMMSDSTSCSSWPWLCVLWLKSELLPMDLCLSPCTLAGSNVLGACAAFRKWKLVSESSGSLEADPWRLYPSLVPCSPIGVTPHPSHHVFSTMRSWNISETIIQNKPFLLKCLLSGTPITVTLLHTVFLTSVFCLCSGITLHSWSSYINSCHPATLAQRWELYINCLNTLCISDLTGYLTKSPRFYVL